MQKMIEQNKAWIDETWSFIEKKVGFMCDTYKGQLPSIPDGKFYKDCATEKDIAWWTNGFWPGLMWLLYVATKEERYKDAAEFAENALDAALKDFPCLHHDVGFMWHISSGANYRITRNIDSKNRNLHAAAALACRFNPMGNFIKAWNEEGFEGWAIVDSMMNIPLLYWAAKETNNIAFRHIATKHADTLLRDFIRPDGSVYHIMDYDIETGELKGVANHTQGYDAENSSWTRGQSWAVYGFVLSYIHTGEQRYLDAAKKIAHYFIAAASRDNFLVKSDFRSPEEPEFWDASAAAITACGLIEIAKAVPEFEQKMYLDAAIRLLKALTDGDECDWTEDSGYILHNCTGSWNNKVNQPYLFGDYYFVEAMYKLKGFDLLFW